MSNVILNACRLYIDVVNYLKEVRKMFVDFGSNLTPTSVISSYRLLSSPVGVVTRQKHRVCWGLVLKAGGTTYYNQNGVKILSDKNHIVLLPKGAMYEWTCTEPGECIVIDFDAVEEDEKIRCVEVMDNTPFWEVFTKMEHLSDAEDTVSALERMQLIYGLLAFLSKTEHRKYIPRDKRHLLSPAINYMMENYANSTIQNDDLAALCGMSTVYFRKTFEEVYSSPPIRYLHRLRMQKAKAILTGDYDSISQVAESTGYSSVYHFSKMFRLYTGESPSEYAKRSRK